MATPPPRKAHRSFSTSTAFVIFEVISLHFHIIPVAAVGILLLFRMFALPLFDASKNLVWICLSPSAVRHCYHPPPLRLDGNLVPRTYCVVDVILWDVAFVGFSGLKE